LIGAEEGIRTPNDLAIASPSSWCVQKTKSFYLNELAQFGDPSEFAIDVCFCLSFSICA
jgi:hypothetical protein